MNKERDQELERRLHAQLRSLPMLKAPAALIPRVMAEIRAQASLPWWRRSWSHWPRGMQFVFLVLSVGLVAIGALGLGLALEGFSWQAVGTWVSSRLESFKPLVDTVAALVNAAALVFRSGLQQLLLIVLGGAMVMYLACVGIGTACFRLAWRRV